MIALNLAPWLMMIALVLAGIVTAAIAPIVKQPLLGLLGVVPVVIWVLVLTFGGQPVAPFPGLWSVLALGLAILGILDGNPLTVLVLRYASPDGGRLGEHGGIIVEAKQSDGGASRTARAATATREVLRGGTTIGYLERIGIVGAIAIGHPEVLAAIIAVKGLGRFSELDSAAARERFIIGTLVSMTWATVCGVLIRFGVAVPTLY